MNRFYQFDYLEMKFRYERKVSAILAEQTRLDTVDETVLEEKARKRFFAQYRMRALVNRYAPRLARAWML